MMIPLKNKGTSFFVIDSTLNFQNSTAKFVHIYKLIIITKQY